MITKEDRIAIDEETLLLMIKEMGCSVPYTEKNMVKAFYEGQKTMLYKLEQMVIAHMTGIGLKGVIMEDDLEKLNTEVSDAADEIGS